MELHSSRWWNRRSVGRVGAVSSVVVAMSSMFVMSSTQAWTPTTPQVTVSTFGGIDADMITDTAMDSSGNMYAVGYFQGTADFNPGAATSNLVSAGDTDIFVMKLDSSGDFVWAHRFGASGADQGNSVAVDSTGNVFLTGYFSGTADFNPSPSTTDNLVSTGAWDAFVLKLTTAGDFAWAQAFGHGSANDSGTAITVESSTGHAVVSGFFAGTVDFDPHPSTATSLSASSGRIFIIKLTSSGGGLIWGKNVGGSSNDESSKVVVDSSGATIVIGRFTGAKDFDPSGAATTLISAGSTDAFILKLSIAGNFEWAKQIGGTNADLARSVTVDSSGIITLSGDFWDTVDFNPDAGVFNLTSAGYEDAFVVQLGSDGSFRWARTVGGSNVDYGRAVVVDSSGNVYLTGRFHGSNADFNPSPTATNVLTSAGGADVYVLKLDMLGMFSWVKRFGSFGTDEGLSAMVDATGNIVIGGRFEYTVAFDPDSASPTIASAGGTDSFIAKLTSVGSTAPTTAAPTTAAPTTAAPTTAAPITAVPTTVAVATTVATGSPAAARSDSATSTTNANTTVTATTSPSRSGPKTSTTAPRTSGVASQTTSTTTASSGAIVSTTSTTSTTTAPVAAAPVDSEELKPGDTGVTVDAAPANFDVTEENGSLVVTVDGTNLTYAVTDTGGLTKAVSKTNFVVEPGDSISVSVAEASESGSVSVWLKPDDVQVGSASLASGSAKVTITFDSDLDSGDRRLVLVTSDRAGRELVVTQGLTIRASKGSSAPWSRVLVVVVGVAVLAGFFVPAVRRRREEEEATAPQ